MSFSPKGKILILRYARLGRTPSALYSAEILARSGFPIVAFEYGLPSEPVKEADGEIPRRRYAWPRSRFLPSSLQASFGLAKTFLHLFLLCVRERPKAILAHGLPESVLALFLGKVLRLPYVVHIHEVYERGKVKGLNGLLLLFEGVSLRHAVFTICSEAKRAEIYTALHRLPRKPVLAFNCPPLRKAQGPGGARTQWAIPSGKPVLLYIGGVEQTNLILEAVEATAAVAGLYFVIVGWCDEGFRFKLERKIRELGVTDRVKVVGEIEDKWEALEASDISWCLYQPHELRTQHLATSSNKLMEAVAAGLTVLAGPNPDFVEFLGRYKVGITTKAFDTASIREALQSLVGSPERLKAFREAGLAAHRSELHYEYQYRESLARWRELLGPPSS
jgi:glycosyltransferase involved in cell wall biosynthesis